jgi:Protein of unknown function (DUF3153)
VQKIRSFFRAIGYLCSLVLLLALTSCVKYDTTIDFNSFNSGELIQHINLDQQFYEIDRPAIDTWLKSIEQRATQMGGQVSRVNPQDLTVRVPFKRVSELVTKFNRFFALNNNTGNQQTLTSRLAIAESNFLVASRYRLNYDIDLHSLSPSQPGFERAKSLDLQFALNVANSFGAPQANSWQLRLGEANHLTTVFWLVNPIGMGGIAIALLVGLGYLSKSLTTKLN